MKLVKEKPVSLGDVHELLAKRQKDTTGEFPYEQQNTLDYSSKFTDRITPAKAKDLKRELDDLGFLTPEHITTLIDILPKKDDAVKAILTGEKLDLTEEQVKETAKVLKKYAKA